MITGEIDIDGMTNVGGSTSAKTSNVATGGAEGLSKVFGLLGETLDKSAEFKPVEGDSGIVNLGGESFVSPRLKMDSKKEVFQLKKRISDLLKLKKIVLSMVLIKFRIAGVLLPLLIIIGCSGEGNNSSGDSNRCYSQVISLMLITENYVTTYKVNSLSENKDQHATRGDILDKIDYLARDIIDRSGGVKENGYELFNGCEGSGKYYSYFQEYKDEVIRPLYDSLDPGNASSKRFASILDSYFFDESPYLSGGYFKESKVFQVSSDLFVLQLNLIN